MAYEIPGFSFSLVAAADLTLRQFRLCDADSTGKAAMPAANGRAIGVIQNKAGINEATTIVHSGISKIVAGGVVAAGAACTTDNQGRVTAAATGNTVHGIALEAASAAGVVIAVLLTIHSAGQSA